MSRDPPERWPRQGEFDQSLWQPGGALELGGNGLAADGLATPLSAGASVGAGLVRSKRAKRRLVVKAARRLAIDLWRLATEQTTAEKLG